MITQKILWSLIALTAALFLIIHLAAQVVLLAGLAVGTGLIWLVVEVKRTNPLRSLFFLAFLVLAILGSLSDGPIVLILLGLSTDLAAWDLSRFRERIADETESHATAVLERMHLQKLTITAGAGFFIALLPTFIHLSIDFVIFFLVTLLAMLVLRRSALYFRHDQVEE